MSLMRPVKIGSTKFDNNIFLAPLSGSSDLAFRLIARQHGAGLCFFEMIDAHSVVYGPGRKTASILKTVETDAPIAAQLLGEDPSIMLRAANEIVSRVNPSFLDINAACPAKKVIKKRAGSYLLRDPKRLYEIVKRLALSLPIPVTVKIRIGYDEKWSDEIAGLAKGCELNGASAVFVHGRTRIEKYSGEVNYDAIRKIKEAVNIPVFGSGNILTPESSKRMFDETGCDGILVARGALGNPGIFGRIEDYLAGRPIPPDAGLKPKKIILKQHLSYIERYKDCSPSGKVGCMRKVTLWYTRGLPNAKRIREKVSLANTYEMMIKLIDSL